MKKVESKLKFLLYILPLLALHFTALHFTALPSDAANSSYNGQALYTSKFCNTCHDTALYTALPIIGIAGRGDDISLTKNATTTNKSRTGVITNMQPYQSMWTDTELQAITNYTFPTSSTMPVPTGPNAYSTANKETPVISAVATSAYPIGVGNLTGNVLNWQIGLPAFAGPVDILAAVQIGANILFVNSSNQLVPLSQPFPVWRSVTGSKINESITENLGMPSGNLSTSGNHGTPLVFYVAVVPKGDLTFSSFYLWSTQVTL